VERGAGEVGASMAWGYGGTTGNGNQLRRIVKGSEWTPWLGWNTGRLVDECQVEAHDEGMELHGNGTVPIGQPEGGSRSADEQGLQGKGRRNCKSYLGVYEISLQENILHVKINSLEYHMLVMKREQ
jgi:hypothetical protein